MLVVLSYVHGLGRSVSSNTLVCIHSQLIHLYSVHVCSVVYRCYAVVRSVCSVLFVMYHIASLPIMKPWWSFFFAVWSSNCQHDALAEWVLTVAYASCIDAHIIFCYNEIYCGTMNFHCLLQSTFKQNSCCVREVQPWWLKIKVPGYLNIPVSKRGLCCRFLAATKPQAHNGYTSFTSQFLYCCNCCYIRWCSSDGFYIWIIPLSVCFR